MKVAALPGGRRRTAWERARNDQGTRLTPPWCSRGGQPRKRPRTLPPKAVRKDAGFEDGADGEESRCFPELPGLAVRNPADVETTRKRSAREQLRVRSDSVPWSLGPFVGWSLVLSGPPCLVPSVASWRFTHSDGPTRKTRGPRINIFPRGAPRREAQLDHYADAIHPGPSAHRFAARRAADAQPARPGRRRDREAGELRGHRIKHPPHRRRDCPAGHGHRPG